MRKLMILLTVGAILVVGATAGVVVAGNGTDRSGSMDKDIVETAVGDDRFDTLVDLVQTAGLAEALSGEGPLTVFAPTDKAFSKVPESTLRALKKDREQLRTVLLYHVVDGRYRAARLLRAESVESLAGPRLNVRERDGGVRVAGAKVVQANVAASNGVIHAINRVLIPPSD